MNAIPRRELNRIAREKRILKAALAVFSQAGYSGTTMDAVAKASGLSKPTLYQYFDSKAQLFSAMMLARRNNMLLSFESPSANAMVQQLHTFAWRYGETVMRPDFLSLARLIIGEAQRFPEIGRAYQGSGPDQVLRGMMAYLNDQRRLDRLAFDDAELAAQDLWGLILSAPRNQALHEPDNIPGRATLARYINNGLRVFLRAYSTRIPQDLATLASLTEQVGKADQTTGVP